MQAEVAFRAGERDPALIRALVRARLEALVGAEVDYVSLADDKTLDELEGTIGAPALLSVVVRFGTTRLLDNVELHP